MKLSEIDPNKMNNVLIKKIFESVRKEKYDYADNSTVSYENVIGNSDFLKLLQEQIEKQSSSSKKKYI